MTPTRAAGAPHADLDADWTAAVMERSAAVLMAAAAAFILLYHWRRRRKYNLKASAISDPTTFSAAAFASHAQNTAQPNQCVLIAASTHGIRNLWQGSFSLIAADLRATLGHHHAANSLSLLEPCLADAFALRKELVNLKKACLRTFHDVDKVIEQLQRQDQYFFRDTSSGHVCGCVALAPLADAPLDLDAHRAEYESVCHCFQRAKGLILAMHDARTNRLTFGSFDPYSHQPSYKHSAVRIDSVANAD